MTSHEQDDLLCLKAREKIEAGELPARIDEPCDLIQHVVRRPGHADGQAAPRQLPTVWTSPFSDPLIGLAIAALAGLGAALVVADLFVGRRFVARQLRSFGLL
jgi:hypothetical protein